MSRLIGAHTVDQGGIHMAAIRAGRGGMDALQIFSAIPKYYGDKTSIRPERVQRFREALRAAGIEPANVLVHAAYVLNTATADEEKWGRAAAGLKKELERSTALGVGGFCFHPGAATGGDRDAAVGRIARAITEALKAIPGDTRVLVENTAGAGMTMGRTPEEVGGILDAVPAALRRRTGYGLDTCHLFSAGHDITASAAAFKKILDQFESAAGAAAVLLSSQRQRATLWAPTATATCSSETGRSVAEPFRWLLHDKRSAGIPLILETPQENYEPADDDESPDPFDVRMMTLLRSLSPSGLTSAAKGPMLGWSPSLRSG